MHPRHRVADPPHAEIRQRQPNEMLKQTRPQLHIHAGGGMREGISPQPAEQSFKNTDAD